MNALIIKELETMFEPLRAAALAGAALFAISGTALAQGDKPKPAAQKPQKNDVKGQGQLAGAAGTFGTVYSLKNNFNFAVVGARYTLEPFDAYVSAIAEPDQKIVVLDLAIKNVMKQDNFFPFGDLVSVVDQDGKLYTFVSLAQKTKGASVADWTLKPGQGLGQVELKDPLQCAVAVPARARIVKIIVNAGRLGTQEDVLRYYIAGATKAEAGEAGDPKNIIAPLPDGVKDPADKSGAVALDEPKATIGTFYPSGRFNIKLDSFAYSSEKLLPDNDLEEDKKYAVATVTAKNVNHEQQSVYDIDGGDSPPQELVDSDGEKYRPIAMLKPNRPELADREMKAGDVYTVRLVFLLPKDATAKKLSLACERSRKWAYDVSGVK
jgi:hypothetical protein